MQISNDTPLQASNAKHYELEIINNESIKSLKTKYNSIIRKNFLAKNHRQQQQHQQQQQKLQDNNNTNISISGVKVNENNSKATVQSKLNSSSISSSKSKTTATTRYSDEENGESSGDFNIWSYSPFDFDLIKVII